MNHLTNTSFCFFVSDNSFNSGKKELCCTVLNYIANISGFLYKMHIWTEQLTFDRVIVTLTANIIRSQFNLDDLLIM